MSATASTIQVTLNDLFDAVLKDTEIACFSNQIINMYKEISYSVLQVSTNPKHFKKATIKCH